MFTEPHIILAICLTMVLAGTVKGIIGLGLPTIGLGVLATFIGLQDAIALMLVPAIVTNIWQASRGGQGVIIFRRIWLFLLSSAVVVWPGVLLLSKVDVALTTGLLGGLLISYGMINLMGFGIAIDKPREKPIGIFIGFANGIVTGMTGSLGIPGIFFLQALGFSRHKLVQSMGLLFASSTFMLAISMQAQGLLTQELGWASVLTLVPTLVGMAIGNRLRDRLSEAQFRRFFFWFLLVLGGYIVMKSVLAFLG